VLRRSLRIEASRPRAARPAGVEFMSDADLGKNRDVLYRDILGIAFTPERVGENLAAFHDILLEIAKLRRLDLTDVHPAIIFEPTAPYRRQGGK
jgi:hypothetical protein